MIFLHLFNKLWIEHGYISFHAINYSFFFAATTLTGLHFVTTTLMTIVFRWLGLSQPSHLPLADLIKFVIFSNLSIVGMNVSLMWNSVGFYQVSVLLVPAFLFELLTTKSILFPSSDSKAVHDTCIMSSGGCLWPCTLFPGHKAEHNGCAYRSCSLHSHWCQCECKRSNCGCYSCLEHSFATICKFDHLSLLIYYIPNHHVDFLLWLLVCFRLQLAAIFFGFISNLFKGQSIEIWLMARYL